MTLLSSNMLGSDHFNGRLEDCQIHPIFAPEPLTVWSCRAFSHGIGMRDMWISMQVDPSRVAPVDCSKEGPEDWAPYENYVEQRVYVNGTTSPSQHHKNSYHDWQYVLRLKAG